MKTCKNTRRQTDTYTKEHKFKVQKESKNVKSKDTKRKKRKNTRGAVAAVAQ